MNVRPYEFLCKENASWFLTILFRGSSKISTSSHHKSGMYPGIQDTWHGRCSGEGIGDGYPCLCTSSWPEILSWAWEIWPRTIQWRWKDEETSLRVFALRRGSKDMYRQARNFVTFIAIQIMLGTTEIVCLASPYIASHGWL